MKTQFTSTETTPFFWDCQCKENYIQSRFRFACPKCDAERDESPDARIEEVGRFLNSLPLSTLRTVIIDNNLITGYNTHNPAYHEKIVEAIVEQIRDKKL